MKRYQILTLFAVAAIMVLCYSACEEEEKNAASLEINTIDVFLDVHGLNENEEPATLNVTTTATWSAHCATWITISPSAGAIGATQVVVTAGSTDEERTGYITFRSGNQQKVITVSQVPYEAVETELAVTPATISVLSDGLLSDGVTPAIAITSNKAWTLSGYPEWIIPSDIAGAIGTSTVTLDIAAYTVIDNDRTATLTVNAGVRSQTVLLTQAKQPILDDGKSVGYIYFEDDFAWATGGSDDIATYVVGSARNIYTYAGAPGSAAGDLLKIFNDHGYTDPFPDGQVIYFLSDYLKFSKTAVHGGLKRGIPNITPDTKTNVKLSVDQVTYKSDPGGNPTAGNYDPNGKAGITTFALIVELDGPGSVGVDDGATKSGVLHDMYEAPGTPWAWETVNIVLYGVTSETKVTIKTDQVNTAAMLCRYYLDNLKFEKHSVAMP
jgi:hypothetical protein